MENLKDNKKNFYAAQENTTIQLQANNFKQFSQW